MNIQSFDEIWADLKVELNLTDQDLDTMSNVFLLPGVPKSPEQVLQESDGEAFEDLIILGYGKEDGNPLIINLSSMSLSTAYFLLEQAKLMILKESLE